tara:strand:+ start:177 stop:416 length:240 start_codon:yes stop_codon:yes gene_type:complete
MQITFSMTTSCDEEIDVTVTAEISGGCPANLYPVWGAPTPAEYPDAEITSVVRDDDNSNNEYELSDADLETAKNTALDF